MVSSRPEAEEIIEEKSAMSKKKKEKEKNYCCAGIPHLIRINVSVDFEICKNMLIAL